MHRIIILIISISLFSTNCIATDNFVIEPEQELRHPILPLILGAGLITWGVYELGDSSQDGQRNVQVLWGSAVIASAGIVIYQLSTRNKSQLTLQPSINKSITLAFNYEF